MNSYAEIKGRLEQGWLKFLTENYAKLSATRIEGTSPPSVFVGRFGYPKVKVGPMVPPMYGDTTVMDKPELWTGKTIEEIANYRLSLVRGVRTNNVNDVSGRFLENLQELAMSKRPVESELTCEKSLLTDLELAHEIRLNTDAAPFGPAAPLKSFSTTSILPDHRIESAYYDTDMRAADAVMELYERQVEVSVLHRILSMGMLGVKGTRRLVPTRWSISATDDIVSKRLVRENENYPSIDLLEVTRYSHFGNNYAVILMPAHVWAFEMIESWFANTGQLAMAADHEDARGLTHYPSIAGAYFAARLAAAEHLSRRRRKGAAVVLREIHPEYVMPLGVWQIREGVREAMRKDPERFETLEAALSFASSGMSTSKTEILRYSQLWRTHHSQTRITDFA